MTRFRLAPVVCFLWVVPAAAQPLIVQHLLPMSVALEAATAALAECSAEGFHASATVVDANGDVKVQIRGDATRAASPETSRRKAYTAAIRHTSSADYAALMASRAGRPPNAGSAPDPNLIQSRGGLPILVGDEVIGGIGVSGDGGGAKDEGCAASGIVKIKDRLR